MSLLIVFHSLYSLSGGVDNRLSELEINLPSEINREYLLFKDEVDLLHKGNISFISSLFIPKFILKNKFKLKPIAYLYGLINLIIRIYQTRKHLKKNNFTTILAVDDYFSLIVLLSVIGLNIKVICSVRNNWNHLYDNNMIHLLPDFMYKVILVKLMNKYANKIHCVSRDLAVLLDDKYKIKNTICIYNLFDFLNIQEKSLERIDIEYEYFINIGHFNFQKNQKDLIIAYSKMKEKGINEKLVLIGSGPLIEECKELAQKLNLVQEVIFLGKQRNPYKYLKMAKLYISSSLYEGLPAVFVESLALNIPIVSYSFETGASELTDNLSKKNPSDLSSLTLKVLNDKNLYQHSINNGKKIIDNNFLKNIIISKWVEIL